ncbi:unnamed protein product [Rotaria sordida]|uniref:F-box domain-containing protein n=1 Tax=Rotaria sordida TaxID=392033 RepID=A0A815PJE9_9BILA|nr:unnamed protein product [Rotaria sordida]
MDRMTSVTNMERSRMNKFKTDASRSKLSFEQLPNELLLYIFQFLSINDLHRGFYNLNLRLNTICYSPEFKLDLTRLKYAFDYYCSIQRSFASQIYSLKLCDEYDRLTLVNRHMDISLFKNLRAITIRKSSPENFDKILSKLHSLSNLSYLNIYATLIQSPHITTALFSIRSLKRLILYSFDPILLHFTDNTICPWTKLEYLELNGCYMTDFLKLLKYVGSNVKRMVISIFYKRREDPASIDPTIIDNLLCGDGGSPQIPVSLYRLHMYFNYLSLTDFHLVLKLFPNLRHLTFSTSTFDLNFASSTIWHEFISKNLLKLEKFQFYIRITGSVVQQCPSPELVHLFNNDHKKWIDGPVIMDYNHVLESPMLEVYTYSQFAHNGKFSVELYGKERYITTTNNTISIDKNITRLRITLNDNVEQLVSTYQNRTIYPKVTIIIIHSQMTIKPKENDPISRFLPKKNDYQLRLNLMIKLSM